MLKKSIILRNPIQLLRAAVLGLRRHHSHLQLYKYINIFLLNEPRHNRRKFSQLLATRARFHACLLLLYYIFIILLYYISITLCCDFFLYHFRLLIRDMSQKCLEISWEKHARLAGTPLTRPYMYCRYIELRANYVRIFDCRFILLGLGAELKILESFLESI